MPPWQLRNELQILTPLHCNAYRLQTMLSVARFVRVSNSSRFRILSATPFARAFSEGGSVTYSGGQATVGQGGFYGSGGSRVVSAAPIHHPEAIARAADVEELTKIMNSVESLENELRATGGVVNSKTIELKARIKKTISNPIVRDLLKRLEIKGEPVWGLSSKERDLVRAARMKYMSS